MKSLKNVGLAMMAVSVGMAAHARQNTKPVSAPAHSISMYQDTTKKDTTKKDTTKKDTASFVAVNKAPVAFYQDTAKKDTTKKDTSKAFNSIAFYQDTTKKDTAKKDTSSLLNSVAVVFYQDTTKKDTTKKDTTASLNNVAMNSLRRSERMVAVEPVIAAKVESETTAAKKEQPTSV